MSGPDSTRAAPAPTASKAPGTLISGPFLLACLACFLDNLVLHSFVHLPGYLEQLGADELSVGWVMGSMFGAAILARPAIGASMDREGRKRVAIVGAMLHALACALYLTVTTIGPWLYAVRILHGVGQACLFSVLFTIASDLVPEGRRTQGLALFGISGMLPLSLGALLGDAVLAVGSYQALFGIQTGLAVLCVLSVLPLPESRPAGSAGASRGFLFALRLPELRSVWMACFGLALALGAFFTFLKSFVLAVGYGTVGAFFTPYALAAITLRLGFGWVPDRVGPERTLVPALGAVGAGLALLAASSSAWTLGAAGALAGIGHGYAFPIIVALVVERTPPAQRGTAVALFTALFDAGVLAAGPVFGIVAKHSGHPTMFATAAACALAVSAAFATWERRAVVAPRVERQP